MAQVLLPRKTLIGAYRWYAKRRYLRMLREHMGPLWVVPDVDDGPAMTKRLRLLTSSLDERSYQAEYTDAQFFYESYRQAYHFLRMVMKHGFNLRTCGAILDFGCGSARLLRLFRYLDGVRLVGVDANPECIDWCLQNVPDCEFYVNQLTPPLPFERGDQFDLIVSCSVFAHIPIEQQTVWLEEIKRVLKPGGFLVCSVIGKTLIDAQLGAEGQKMVKERREFCFGTDDPRASLSTRAGGSHYDIFQSRDRVIEVFGAVLRLRDYIPDTQAPIGQDVLILQKPA
jgi:SAM-dependent methyltransferase